MKKVVKFGGSSLASARQFKKVKAIIDADKTRGYVVPSAPGKRDGKDTKVTDLLYQCYEACAAGQSYKRILDQIKKRFDDIINGLDLDLNLDFEFDTIEENFKNKAGRAYAASRGECPITWASPLWTPQTWSFLMKTAYFYRKRPTTSWRPGLLP